MNARHASYLAGARHLYNEIEKHTTDHDIVSGLYQQLQSVLDFADMCGPTSDNDATRTRIIVSLNRITERLFHKSFDEYCQDLASQAGSKDTGELTVTVKLLTDIIPTSYCQQLRAEGYPLVHVSIDNRAQDITLQTNIFIEDYSDQAKETISVAKGKQKDIKLLPVLKHNQISTIANMRKATLHYSVTQLVPEKIILKDETRAIYLMPTNQALIALESETQAFQDLTRYLAAWVTPNAPEILRLHREAIDIYRHFDGYASGTAKSVREQARAIFSALKNRGVTYAHSPLNWEVEDGRIMQQVRLPNQSLQYGRCMNCLDGTVLFASLLERSALEPLLVLVPGHAFVGWRVEPETDRYEFLETTMIATDEFERAQTVAKQLYDSAYAKHSFDQQLFDTAGFARCIDVKKYRQEGIYALE